MKIDALKRLEHGESAHKIALDFKVGRLTVLSWRSKKSKIQSISKKFLICNVYAVFKVTKTLSVIYIKFELFLIKFFKIIL